jgi:glycosyltransferase involved in cell wall biosynthesis
VSVSARIAVLRVCHSGVVTSWRRRDRELEAEGAAVTLICARAWDEGGRRVPLESAPDEPVVGVRTLGRHPNLFVYAPIPLWRVLKTARYQILDIHEEPVSLAAAEVQLLAYLARRRTAICLYSAQNIDKRYPPPFRWIERIALRRASAVHTCNDQVEPILRRKGFRGIVENLGLGVDTDRYASHDDARDSGPVRVGYVGRLEKHKGVAVAIDAMTLVPCCQLEIVGGGPLRAELERQVEALELTDRVRFSGVMTAEDLPERYGAFDIVVIPSLETRTWIEQFGRVAVEAMAAGVPVIASESGALPEVVGDAGVLVAPGSASSLAVALRRLAADPHERARLGSLGRKRAATFSWQQVARRQRSLYERVLARER